jgi:hypothetical protein
VLKGKVGYFDQALWPKEAPGTNKELQFLSVILLISGIILLRVSRNVSGIHVFERGRLFLDVTVREL